MSPELALVDLLIVAHELTHLAAARALGHHGRIRIRGKWCPRLSVGITVPAGGMPWVHDVLIAASAPAMNLALVLPLIVVGWDLAAAGSLILAACSLAPIPHRAQDGWRILQAVRARR